MTTADLFADTRSHIPLAPGAVLLGGFALADADALAERIGALSAVSPFRRMETRGGGRMSVAMLNCGQLGWVSDARGYRYDPIDPETGAPWPAMPPEFRALAVRAAAAAGFAGFAPDACLMNRYMPGARLGLHRDADERDRRSPVVSVSLGLPATFLWGGDARTDRTARHLLFHGDVVVWGGPSRMVYHGVDALEDGDHPATGPMRYNLTFRKAG